MKKFIDLRGEAREKIRKHFGITNTGLSYALHYRRNSKQCIAIRKMALENGGVECETTLVEHKNNVTYLKN